MALATAQREAATNTDLAMQIEQALANAAQLPARALDVVLAAAERAGLTDSREYNLLLGEWFVSRRREIEAEQQALLGKVSDWLAGTAGGAARDSSDLAQLLGAMWRLRLEKSVEYKKIYRLWLARFPSDAVRQLVADWVRRWHNQHGQFVGFLASYLLAEFGAEVGGEVTREQVETALTEMAAAGQIISARIGSQVAMYATAAWLAEGQDVAVIASEVGCQTKRR